MTTLIEDNAGGLYIVHNRGAIVWGGRENCDPGTALSDLLLVEARAQLLGNLPMWRYADHYPQGVESQECEIEHDTPPPECAVNPACEGIIAEVDKDGFVHVYVRYAGTAVRRYLGIEEVPR